MAFVKRGGTTRAWTEEFPLTLLLAVMTVAFSFIAVMDVSRFVWAEMLIIGFVIVASVRAGAAGGLVVGLVGAALHIGLRSIVGDEAGRGATLSVVVLCAFIVYGWLFGLAAAHLRRQQEIEVRPAATVGAGYSQGLLTAGEGRALLDLEAEKARSSGDHLAVVIVTATVRQGIRPQQAAHAFRAVARTFEATATGTQYPVLLSDDQLAMVLPGGQPGDGRQLELVLLSSMSEATYADRDAGTRPKALAALLLASDVVILTESPAKVAEIFSLPERRLAMAAQRNALPARTAA